MFYRVHDRVITCVGVQTMTKQSHKSECDINTILRQFQKTGIISHINNHKGEYVNLPDSIDYQDGLNTVLRGEAAFAALPSKVRDHYDNDPLKFLAAFGDDVERKRLEEWGLINPPVAPGGAVPPVESPPP